MRPGAPQEVPTLADVVHRAVAVCDPEGADPLLADLLARFEDRDEPVTAVEDIDGLLAEATRSLDADADDPALVMGRAVAVYLAHRRDEMGDPPAELLRLAARAEFDGDPPDPVARWLDAAGIRL